MFLVKAGGLESSPVSLRPWEELGNCVLGKGGVGGVTASGPPGSVLTSLSFFFSGGSIVGEGSYVFSLEELGQEPHWEAALHSLCKCHLNCLFSHVLVSKDPLPADLTSAPAGARGLNPPKGMLHSPVSSHRDDHAPTWVTQVGPLPVESGTSPCSLAPQCIAIVASPVLWPFENSFTAV